MPCKIAEVRLLAKIRSLTELFRSATAAGGQESQAYAGLRDSAASAVPCK
ncbi:MAG: hypothetical protein VX777_08430 [Chlamydiota bacterium]|nr:hypothetical protein [Chlamydiota bacterium]